MEMVRKHVWKNGTVWCWAVFVGTGGGRPASEGQAQTEEEATRLVKEAADALGGGGTPERQTEAGRGGQS